MASPYVGAEVGLAQYQDACGEHATRCDEGVLGYGAFGGYAVNDWLAVEAGVRDYGTPKASYGATEVEAGLWGVDSSALLSYPVMDSLSVFGRVGVTWIAIDKQVSGLEVSDSQWRPLLGGGVNYALNDNWALRAEYRFIDGVGTGLTDRADLHTVTLGASYRFGNAATDIATTTTTKLEPAPPTIPPVKRYLKVQADTAFAFDSATLRPTAHDALKPMVSALLASSNAIATVVGHTDSHGNAEYNRHLSERRALAVSDYLVSQGVAPFRITVKGMGEAQPIADNATAEGRARNRRVDLMLSTSESAVSSGSPTVTRSQPDQF